MATESNERSSTVTYERIATTRDVGFPVLKCEFRGSHMKFILDREDDCINVWYVESVSKGHMKIMLDATIGQLPFNRVNFVAPLDKKSKKVANEAYEKVGLPESAKFDVDEHSEDLEDVLDGFEHVEKVHEGKTVPILTGLWETEDE